MHGPVNVKFFCVILMFNKFIHCTPFSQIYWAQIVNKLSFTL